MAINFERGKDPRSTMGIGLEKEIEKFLKPIIEEHRYNLANAEIRKQAKEEFEKVSGYKVTMEVDKEEETGDWYATVKLLPPNDRVKVRMKIPDGFIWPTMTKVAARTVAMDLVPVQPMAKPKGSVFYMDYQYGNKNKNNVKFRKRKKRNGLARHRKS